MQRILLTMLILLAAVFLLVSCQEIEETTVNSGETTPKTTSSVCTTVVTTTQALTTNEPIKEAVNIELLFTEPYVCASQYDIKSGGVEGVLVNWDRWYSTDYIDVSEFYALYYELGSHKYLMSLSFYDESKDYISGIGTTSTSDAAMISGFVEIPENATYARAITFTGISSQNATWGANLSGFLTKRDYEAACLEYPHRELVIACIGDSLTEGDIGCFTPGIPDRSFQNYPYYLGKELGCRVINYGKCGYTAEMILNSYRQKLIDITKADLILIMLGTNAGLKTNGLSQYNAYLSLLSLIEKDMKDGAKLILITPPHAASRLGSVYRCVEEASKTVLVIAEDKGLSVIDAHNDSPIQEKTENLYQPNDGLHMVERGYQVFAEFIAREVLDILTK